MTAPVLTLSEDVSFRERCVVFEDGSYWFAQGYDKDHGIGERILRLQAMNKLPRETARRTVDLEQIRDAYGNQSAGTPLSPKQSIDTRLERAFERAAEARASDLKFDITQQDFHISAIINDRLYLVDDPWTVADGRVALHKFFYNKDDRSGQTSYQPHMFQGFAMRAGGPIRFPEGVTAIRGQRGPNHPAGEHMYIRLFYADSLENADLATLGFDEEVREQFARVRRSLSGATIIGGVTGDGKSTTMGANLVMQQREHDNRLNMVTVEDPVEYTIPFATQIAVSTAASGDDRGAAFTDALSHFVRVHPKVGMVSEVRDSDAAGKVVEFVNTGHQVWTTIHVDQVNGIPFRLMSLGVPAVEVCKPGTLALLVKQTLVPILCDGCKVPPSGSKTTIPDWLYRDLGKRRGFFLRNPDGCHACREQHGSSPLQQAWWGYSGRKAVAETIQPDMAYLRFVQALDPVGAWTYWTEQQGGNPIDNQVTRMVALGTVDPFDALGKGVTLKPDNVVSLHAGRDENKQDEQPLASSNKTPVESPTNAPVNIRPSGDEGGDLPEIFP